MRGIRQSSGLRRQASLESQVQQAKLQLEEATAFGSCGVRVSRFRCGVSMCQGKNRVLEL